MELPDNQLATHTSAILRNTPNGVLLVDKDTRIRYVNPAFLIMFKCDNEDVLNQSARDLLHSDCFERAIKAGGSLMVKERISEHNVSVRAGIFPIEEQDLYCGIFIDISE